MGAPGRACRACPGRPILPAGTRQEGQRHDEFTTQRRSPGRFGLFGIRPIRIRRRCLSGADHHDLTPFAAGSVTDAAARVVAQALQETLGQSVVVENRAGAGGLLAANAVARAGNDAYTLLLTTNSPIRWSMGCSRTCPTIRSRISPRSPGSAASRRLSRSCRDKPYQYEGVGGLRQGQSRQAFIWRRQQPTQIVMEALKKRTGSASFACPTAAIRW